MRPTDLTENYGVFMDSSETAEALRFPSRDALLSAIARGGLQLTKRKFPGRRRVYFSTIEVQEVVDAMLAEKPHGDAQQKSQVPTVREAIMTSGSP